MPNPTISPWEDNLERIVAVVRHTVFEVSSGGPSLSHFIRKTLNMATQPAGVAFTLGKIPANAIVIGDAIYISTAPNGTTNTLDVGYSSDALSVADDDAYASALAIPVTTGLGRVVFDELGNTSGSASKRARVTTLTATRHGTATTGVLDIVVEYVADNP